MPLVIPPPRNLRRENFAGYLETRQELRIQREAREHQEGIEDEARDKEITGQVVGLTLAAVGAGLGGAGVPGGLTAAQGVQIAAVGAQVGRQIGGGDVSGGIATGLQGAATLMQAETDRKKTEKQKQIDFNKYLLEEVGGDAVALFNESRQKSIELAKASGVDPSSPQDSRLAFFQAHGSELQQMLFARKQGGKRAELDAVRNAATLEQFYKAPIHGEKSPAELRGLPEGYTFTPQQKRTYNSIQDDRQALKDLDFTRPDQKRRDLAENKRRMDELALEVKRSPKVPQTVEEVEESGQGYELGRAYTSSKVPGYVRTISPNGSINEAFIPGTVYDVGPDTQFRSLGGNKSTFHAGRRPDGKLYPVGAPYTREDGVKVQWDKDGESVLSPMPKLKSGSDLVGEAVKGVLDLKSGITNDPWIATKSQEEISETMSAMVGATIQTQFLAKDIVRIAEFRHKWRSAPDFDVIFSDMLRTDRELGALNAKLQDLMAQATVGLSVRGEQAARGIAKKIVTKLGAIQDEVAGLGNQVVARDYLAMLARYESIAK